MKQNTKYLSFKKSIKSWQLWSSAFAYHITSLLIFRLLPQPVVQKTHNVVFEKPTALEKMAVTNLVQSAPQKPVLLNIVVLINILFFDAIFVIIFMVIKRYKSKKYNLLAVVLTTIAVNFLFFLYFKSLQANFF